LLLKIAVKLHLNALLGPQLVFFIVLVATIAAGCVAYLLVERPLIRLLRGRRRDAEPAGARPGGIAT
jgi:peptidoglycan/LPS O-acetylase OafA/YrhL